MTHPGLAVMLVVGVGLGAVLYYFFASPPEPMGQRSMQPRNNNRPDSNRTYWSSQPSDPRNRRQDQKCMVCLEEINKEDAVKIIRCNHVFHKQCIEEWRAKGSGEARQSCPNCRDKIIGLEEIR